MNVPMKNLLLIFALIIIIFTSACKQAEDPAQGSPAPSVQYPSEYVLDEIELVPEGIAYSTSTKKFYLTSVAKSKIIEVERITGAQKDFIGEGAEGYSPGVGIYVDDQRQLLHAIGGYYMTNDSLSSLYTFDLISRKLVARHDVTGDHFLNDMVKDTEGNIYLTDTKGASVYLLKSGSDELEVFYSSPEIDIPNGIAISDDNTILYVASITKGIRIFNIKTKELLNEEDSTNKSKGIDGLEYYRGALYGVQNSAAGNPFNFRKLLLNAEGDTIMDVEVIDSGTPNLDVPLTFCFADNQAVVIGNSNLGHLNQETLTFPNPEALTKTKLIVYKID